MTLDRRCAFAAAALALGYLALVLALTREGALLTPDSIEYAALARSLLHGEGYTIGFVPLHVGLHAEIRHVPELHGVLRPFALLPWFALFGVGEAAARVPGLVYAAATGLLAFAFARRVFGPWAGLLAAFVVLAQPLLFLSGWSGNDDVGLACFALATLLALHRALATQRSGDFAIAGIAAALAVLEKLAGAFLLAAFALPAWRAFRTPRSGASGPARRLPRRRLLALLAPLALAFAAHAVRNLAAHGSPLPRASGGLEWLFKAGGALRWETYFALYDPAPGLAETLRAIGAAGVASVLAEQLGAVRHWFLSLDPGGGFRLRESTLLAPGVLATLGLLALPFHARRDPTFAALVALALSGALAGVLLLHHVELRYFLFAGPLLAISLAGAVARLAPAAANAPHARARRALAAAVGLCVVGSALAAFASGVVMRPALGSQQEIGRCRAALDHFLASTSESEPLLSFVPWSVAWETQRLAVQIPSGGADALAAVARHYRVRFVLAPVADARRPQTAQGLDALPEPPAAGLAATRVFEADRCRLLRLEPGGAS